MESNYSLKENFIIKYKKEAIEEVRKDKTSLIL